jgi:hypothetical protein
VRCSSSSRADKRLASHSVVLSLPAEHVVWCCLRKSAQWSGRAFYTHDVVRRFAFRVAGGPGTHNPLVLEPTRCWS